MDSVSRRHEPACPIEQYDLGLDLAPPVATTARNTNREARWRRQLASGLAYALNKSPEEAEIIIAEFERQERAGPDFLDYRNESAYADAPSITLDRNGRVRLLAKFRALARHSWAGKESRRHRGMISRTCEDVFGALMYLAGKYGRVFPSLIGLGKLAKCCKQSVVTAIEALEGLGFVTKTRRIRNVVTPLGFRVEQVTNAYDLHEPKLGLGLLALAVIAKESSYWAAREDEVLDLSCFCQPSPLFPNIFLVRKFRGRRTS